MNDRRTRDIGVILCDCNGELRKRLNFARLEKKLGEVSAVTSVKSCSDLSDTKQCHQIVRAMAKSGACRLAIAGPDIAGFERPLLDALEKAKLNPGLYRAVNIREQCALACPDKKAATEKAIERITAAVTRVALAQPVKTTWKKIRQNVVVVGGGVAGLQAVAALAKRGLRVDLAHEGETLGGTAAATPELYAHVGRDSDDARRKVETFVRDLVGRVEADKRVIVHPGAHLKSVTGELGNFELTISSPSGEEVLSAGAIVLATGSRLQSAAEVAGIAASPRIIDMQALVERIHAGDVPDRVAIVMDITGEQGRAATIQALSAAEILRNRFGVRVKLYCTNMRVAATGIEELYRRTREAGVVIAKLEKRPAITPGSANVVVASYDAIAGVNVSDEFDIVALADLCAAETDGAASIVPGLRPGPDGALQYDDVWLLTTLTNRPGVFVAGASRGNSEYRDALNDGLAVANEIHELLAPGKIQVRDNTATVDTDKCVLCLTCVRICPHGAITIDNEKNAADVSPVSCKRCGVCASECPAQAITIPGLTIEQEAADVGERPRITVFACENSAIPAANAAAGSEYGVEIQLISVTCAGEVDPRSVLAALEKGAEQVLILGCHPESCQYLSGSSRASKRAERISTFLEEAGFDKSRVRFAGIASVEPARFIEYVTHPTD